jgi:hypothetical protein
VSVLGTWQGQPQMPSRAALAGNVRLLGYDLEPTSPLPGQQVQVTLYWQALRPMAEPYSSFVHITRNDGSVPFAGSDHRPGGDIYPATLWRLDQIIRDQHVFTIPLDAEAGQYKLIAGMYAYPSMRSLGDTVPLGQLNISAGW